MTGRERVIATIERQPLDRIPRYDGFWEDTLQRWKREGLQLPEVKKILVEGEEKCIGRPVDFCFDLDMVQLFMDISMRFPTGVVEDDGVKIPVAMAGGGYIYHSDHSIPSEVSLETYLHATMILDEIGTYRQEG